MMAWAELAESHISGAEFNDGSGNGGRLKRGDVAAFLMTIVGSVLWGAPTSAVPSIWLGERRLNDNLFGRDCARRGALNISFAGIHCQLIGANNPA